MRDCRACGDPIAGDNMSLPNLELSTDNGLNSIRRAGTFSVHTECWALVLEAGLPDTFDQRSDWLMEAHIDDIYPA